MLYHYLQGDQWRHIWIVGDLHGCRKMLDRQMASSGFDPNKDLLIAVGDLIDRGPDSAACLALLEEPWFRSVRGNHEQMALDALMGGGEDLWEINGGEWYQHLTGGQQQRVYQQLLGCDKLPLILHLQLDNRLVVVAHADYPGGRYAWGQEVDTQRVVWGRERIARAAQGEGDNIGGADEFYFGHTPLQSPLSVWNQHYIDTGAVFGNALTMVRVQ